MTNELANARAKRISALETALQTRILVLDGAMGTAIQNINPSVEDFGGLEYEGCNEYLVITRPDMIREIHRAHLASGVDIIETNTFGGAPVVLDEFGLGKSTYEINYTAAKLAREECDRVTTPEKPRFVAGSMGPTTKAISVTGGITFEALIDNFYQQAKALAEGGVDYLLLETCQDTRNVKAGILGIQKYFKECGGEIPIAVSGTIEPMGTMLAGQTVEALIASLSHLKLLYLGLNCATGPQFMTDYVRTLAQNSPFRVACVPNAGLPDENGHYLETPRMMSQVLTHFIDSGWVNLIGGCCGTCDTHTAEFARIVRGKQPRTVPKLSGSFLSGIDYLEITEEMRPVIVGERTNVIGSRKFKDLIAAGQFEEATEIARAQVKNGAQILDLCLANPDRNELEDMRQFLDLIIRKVKLPLMIDSTDAAVIEMALTYCQGKAIINSINLEDGEERFEKVVPNAREYGAAFVVGTIDDDPNQGMGVTRQRKLEIAKRSYLLLTEKYGVNASDIYWDPLVFPCGTGDVNYVGSAVETIEGIRLLKEAFPGTKTVLGISNVSFGLPNAGREVLNSVFLYHCVRAGLDLAIVNSQKLVRYASLTEEDKKICDDLIFTRGSDPVAAFAAYFRSKKPTAKKESKSLPLDQRLANYIIEGSRDGLHEDLALKLKEAPPLEIVNGPLMAGMDEVGRLFNANKLIIAEVLQSAEAMKAAVAYLEPFMEKADTASRGKVLLATVKGDVHDIGKNLVEIILCNNGFQVINLGIKVPPEKLIEAIKSQSPDIVGLSGLLVKSAQQMVTTAADFSKAGIKTPMMVGGAALTSNFVDKQIAKAYVNGTVSYAPDAMQGLELAKTIMDSEKFAALQVQQTERRTKLWAEATPNAPTSAVPVNSTRSAKIPVLQTVPQPDDLERHLLLGKTPIDQIWSFINPMMIYGRHLGIRGGTVKLLQELEKNPKKSAELRASEPKAYEIWEAVRQLKDRFRDSPVMKPSAVYQFFPAFSEGNQIHILGSGGKEKLLTFEFPRMNKEPGYCLSDYVHPDPNKGDNVGLFVVSVGKGIRALSEEMKQKGDYLNSHIIQVLALESAEAYAELLHFQMRRMWGFPDPVNSTMLEKFQAKYRGKRYSFGYPACPQLADQTKLFQLLRPEEIGVELTEGYMMDPEASVSAVAFHHPQAAYFTVGKGEE